MIRRMGWWVVPIMPRPCLGSPRSSACFHFNADPPCRAEPWCIRMQGSAAEGEAFARDVPPTMEYALRCHPNPSARVADNIRRGRSASSRIASIAGTSRRCHAPIHNAIVFAVVSPASEVNWWTALWPVASSITPSRRPLRRWF